MHIKDKILKAEAETFKAFADYIEKDYGILYYNESDKESHDSNHANLFPDRILDIENVFRDIKDFYLSKGIVPRIYQPPVTGFFEKHRETLERLGYEVKIFGISRYMLLKEKNSIKAEKKLDIKRLVEWDERIASDIFIPNREEYEIDVVKNLLKNKFSYVFVGYFNDSAVATTYFHTTDYDCTCFDYIDTANKYRRNGYARAILSHAVNFCRQNNILNCYLWPAHKTSEKICYEAGFREIFEVEAGSAIYSL